MIKDLYLIRGNRPLAQDIYLLRLDGDASDFRAPGQFCQIALPEFFLRRPFSVCDINGEGFSVAYRAAGDGTRALSQLRRGARLDILTGLGNGFNTLRSGGAPLLIAGGTGISPMLWLTKALMAEGKAPTVIIGARSRGGLYLTQELAATGARVVMVTQDGSRGKKGVVTDYMDSFLYTHVFACGPEPMLRAVNAKSRTDAQFSLEARMGCGFGACMGCTIETANGPRRVCKDGPVFGREELPWLI